MSASGAERGLKSPDDHPVRSFVDAISCWSVMPEIRELRRTLARVAERWRDPDYEPRAAAVEETLAAPNRFTEEAVAFAVNQQKALVTPDAPDSWLGDAAESPS